MTRHRAQHFGMVNGVDFHLPIIGSGQQVFRIGRKAQRPNRHGMSFQRMGELAGQHVEHVNDAVQRSAGYVLAVRTVRDAQRKLA